MNTFFIVVGICVNVPFFGDTKITAIDPSYIYKEFSSCKLAIEKNKSEFKKECDQLFIQCTSVEIYNKEKNEKN